MEDDNDNDNDDDDDDATMLVLVEDDVAAIGITLDDAEVDAFLSEGGSCCCCGCCGGCCCCVVREMGVMGMVEGAFGVVAACFR